MNCGLPPELPSPTEFRSPLKRELRSTDGSLMHPKSFIMLTCLQNVFDIRMNIYRRVARPCPLRNRLALRIQWD
jgi:hypothetical protein